MNNNYYPFTNTPLPYVYDALEPHIDEETMRLHHDKHLHTYIDNLNKILEKNPMLQHYSLEELLAYKKLLPADLAKEVGNQAGGVYNHRMYFEEMTPDRMPSDKIMPRMNGMNMMQESDRLNELIRRQYGDKEQLEKELLKAALSVFGSGYAWLVWDGNRLLIITLPNQDNPISLGLCPLMNVDVWEHAYYLKNQNRREEYLNHFMNVLNWDKVNNRLAVCMRGYK